jgi:uroporphyrinogen-III synthase
VPSRPLAGIGVLVTRPEHQADELVDAIRAAGGKPVRFPAFDIVARSDDEIADDFATLEPADIVIFVSANAARFGRRAVTGAASTPTVAAIGPATATALESEGITVDVRPEGGFVSEHLLADPAFEDVAGRRVTIVRGESGRELLAETLRQRGASVQYLSVYALRPHDFTQAELEEVTRLFRSREIKAVTIMSIKTFDHLEAVLPNDCRDALAGTRLVAPGGRVVQTLAERLPGADCVESQGPGARAMVDALVASLRDDS